MRFGVEWDEIERASARREFICRNAPHCPKCGTEQVQIIIMAPPAEWKCRSCKHKWEYEPYGDPKIQGR